MNKYILPVLLMIAVSSAQAQIVTTVAGGNGAGSDSIHLYYPYGIWLDGSGRIYVSDQTDNSGANSFYGTNSRIQMFPANSTSATGGRTVAGGNGPGSGTNQLINPAGIFVDSAGNIYVADPGYTGLANLTNDRVMKFPAGGTSATAGTVVAGSTGDAGALSFELNDPLGVFVDDSGYIYVADADNDRIQKFPPGSISGTPGVTVAGDGGVGSIPGRLSYPSSVFVDHSGNIYVADFLNNRIQKFTPPDTNGVTVAGGNGEGSGANQLNSPSAVFVDNNGNIYVADMYNNRVQMFPAGSDSATSGITVAGGNGPGDGPEQLYYPSSIYVDSSGNIYIADQLNNRVQKWSPVPAGIKAVGSEASISLYPNPNNGSFVLRSTSIGTDYLICDMVGRVVDEAPITSAYQSIRIKGISPGSYTLAVKGSNEKALRFVVSE